MIEQIVGSDDPKTVVEELYKDHRARLREFFGRMYDEGGKKLQDKVKEVLRKVLEGEELEIDGEDRAFIRKLVEAEVLFYDPLRGAVVFQTKLDGRAARELIG